MGMKADSKGPDLRIHRCPFWSGLSQFAYGLFAYNVPRCVCGGGVVHKDKWTWRSKPACEMSGWPSGLCARLQITSSIPVGGVNSTHDCTVTERHEPFIITLPSFRYGLNNVERAVKHQPSYPADLHCHAWRPFRWYCYINFDTAKFKQYRLEHRRH